MRGRAIGLSFVGALVLASVQLAVANPATASEYPVRGETAFCARSRGTVLLCVSAFDRAGVYYTDTIARVSVDSQRGQPSITKSTGGWLHVAWCKDGRVYYTGTRRPISPGMQKLPGIPLWLPLQQVSIVACEPAADCAVQTEDERIRVKWQTASSSSPGATETWQMTGMLRPGDYPLWSAFPLNVSHSRSAPIGHSAAVSDQYLIMKRVAQLPDGSVPTNVLCGDTDHNGLHEIIFRTGQCGRWEIWEQSRANCYETVYTDTCPHFPLPHAPQPGSLEPWDIGDIDGDSLTDLLGFAYDGFSGPYHWDLVTVESPSYRCYPESISWHHCLYPSPAASGGLCYFAGDLNNDGRQCILLLNEPEGYLYVFKNEGNNLNEPVWRYRPRGTSRYAVGDFDHDGVREFVSAGLSTASFTYLYKRVANDTFALVWTDTVSIPNGADVFSGDIDDDGTPEFFVRFAWMPTSTAEFYLYMYKAVGVNQYERTLVDHFSRYVGEDLQSVSRCGDVNGDGVDELVWNVGRDVYIYKYIGNNQFEWIWEWHNPTQDIVSWLCAGIHDLNRNGYNEIVLSGVLGGTPGYPQWGTYIYEIEGIRVHSPNGGEALRAGDTCPVHWLAYTPPRCDSVSLFFTTDNGQTYRPIAHGLPPTQTTYSWVIPDVHGDSCRVKAIAYGPGWQFDESDFCFSIWSAGVNEGRFQPVSETRLVSATPSPLGEETEIRYQLRQGGKVEIRICDVSGRTVAALPAEVQEAGLHSLRWGAGHVPKGVYFLSFHAGDYRGMMKLAKIK